MNVAKVGTAGGFGYDPKVSQTPTDPLAAKPKDDTPDPSKDPQAQAVAGAATMPKPTYGPTGLSVDQVSNLLNAVTNDQIVSVDMSV